MRFRTLAVVVVVLMVALSGCIALEDSETGPSSNVTESGPENETDANGDADSNAEDPGESESDAGDADESDDETDPPANGSDGEGDGDEDDGAQEDNTADAEWHPPEEPNRPMEDKREDRIESVEFVDKEPAANGEGYSNFNLEVVANTSMENVDPPEYGDVIGEPYFFVKINEDEQKIVERTGHVPMEENGTFHIDVRPAGIEEFGDGPLTVEVFLMDEDKDWDDIYDSVGTEIYFNPETDADVADDDESDAETDTDGSDDSASEPSENYSNN